MSFLDPNNYNQKKFTDENGIEFYVEPWVPDSNYKPKWRLIFATHNTRSTSIKQHFDGKYYVEELLPLRWKVESECRAAIIALLQKRIHKNGNL